ncbi:MAG: MFS transporter [Actinobacteria bacterium]|nr:MFS transporter [Actinomycetota bacterium]MCA1721523.1 MFS transporter [Actinomycetota bacterium]
MTSATTSAARQGRQDAAASGTLTHRQIMIILSGLMLGMFLSALDQTIVSTAIRTIADKLNGQTAQAWVTTAYLVTSTVSTPLYGKLSDQYGRKPFFLFAIIIFVIGSMLCGIAHSIYELAAYRGLQGLGAGGLMSLVFAIVGDIVPPRERGRYQAYFTSVFATSSVLGPVLGGFFAGQDSILGIDGWRWIFYLNVPVGLAALIVVQRNLNLPSRRSEHRIDYLGAALLTAAVVPLLLVAEKGREWGWGSGLTLGLITASLVGLGLFIPRQAKMGEEAILPLRVFRSRVFTVSSATSFLVGAAMFGGLTSLPLYLQIVRGKSPTVAGLMLVPLMVGIIISSQTSGRIMARTGRYKIFPIIGTAVMTTAMLLFSTLQYDTPIWHVEVFMLVMGAGLGLSMQTLVISVQNALPPRDMGVATSSVTFFRSMGATFGVAIALAILFGSLVGNIKDRALAAHLPAAVLARFDDLSGFNDTSVIKTLPPVVQRVVLQGFADSMHSVFLTVALLLIPAFVLTFFITEVPLRQTSGLAAQQAQQDQQDQQSAGDRAEAATAVV